MSDHQFILVVDDDEAIRHLLTEAFRDDGFHVIAAEDGVKAMSAVSQALPAAVVLDIHLPGIGGLEIAERLKADPATAHVPIIAISAAADRETVLATGCCAFVEKPFDLAELIRTVVDAISVTT